MPLFSQRMGFRPLKKEIQVESLDSATRNQIWNGLTWLYFVKPDPITRTVLGITRLYQGKMLELIWAIWTLYFKNRHDQFSKSYDSWMKILEKCVYRYDWFEVFDFLEFIVKNYEDEEINSQFIEYCNQIFANEAVPYRFIGKEIIPLTNQIEIEEVEKVLETLFEPLKLHFEKALDLFSSRTHPDYSNSIKESISAVECICQIIVGRKGVALNNALKKLEDSGLEINTSLKKGFRQLYGWTSHED
jgi:hypothetical protein